jgi:hypothetical protein
MEAHHFWRFWIESRQNCLICLVRYLHTPLYGVSGAFMLILQDLIFEVIPSQKCQMNVGLILNCYGAMDI